MIQKTRLFIVADDLTGAVDSGVPFRMAGRRVRVGLTADPGWDFSQDARVVQVCDTETRGAPPAEARAVVGRAVQALDESVRADMRVLKKVDSTLRGNIGAELEAILDGLHRRLAVLAPAFPAVHRTVRHGRVFVRGRPLAATEFREDRRTPPRFDRIAEVIRQTSGLPVHEIPLETVRSGAGPLAAALHAIGTAPAVAVVDAETSSDLDAVAGAAAGADWVPCGSAGLARALAQAWCSQDAGSCVEAGAAQGGRPACRNILVVVGSAHPAAREHLSVLQRSVPIRVLTLSAAALSDPSRRLGALEQACEAAHAAREELLAVALSAEQVRPGDDASRPEQAFAPVAAAWLARPAAQRDARAGFVTTGGDTTLAVCRGLGARALWPQGEVAAGVPWSEVEMPDGRAFLVSKAGGFGAPSILVDAVRFLRGGAQDA